MKTLKSFTFKPAPSKASKYKWDEILNGEAQQIFRGKDKDYEVETDAMAPKIKTAARRRFKTVKISRLDEKGNKLKDSLILQAFDMTAEERAEENARRKAKKDARRAEREAAKAGGGAS